MRIPDSFATPFNNLKEIDYSHRKPGIEDGDDWFLQTDGFGSISRVPRYTESRRKAPMKTIQVCDEGDTIPDIAERIVRSLDALLGLEGETAGDEEHKALLETMARIVHKEIVNFLFGE